MEPRQRKQVAAQVVAARAAKGWTQKVLATNAGVAPNTVGAIEKGESAYPSSIGKVMEALEIEPLVESHRREVTPADVQLVVETIGLWLTEMDEADRPAAVLDLIRYIARVAAEETDE